MHSSEISYTWKRPYACSPPALFDTMSLLPTIDSKKASVPLSERELKEIFMQFDTDHNNVLSKEELKKAFKYLGAMIPAFRAWRGINCADANGNGQIEFDEELDILVKYAYKLGYTVK
ncbi:hypothetical protein P3X46_002264 [Hevea brasiliensis]|uniref:EF-hand domain-containing protein n=1 Tax=Hevea brasiliensis TaxID=3981 RepID=A0ABQ9N2D1_HEVBR|nr:hypothetical protein P3X46_002264 [Hevea brasiliensis]